MEQLKEAQQRVKAAGLSEQIRLLYCDYRELPGSATYDALISCEMVEAVGQEHLRPLLCHPVTHAQARRTSRPTGLPPSPPRPCTP